MKNIPSFPLELLTVTNIFLENNNTKRIRSYLYSGCPKKKTYAEPQNISFQERYIFEVNRYA